MLFATIATLFAFILYKTDWFIELLHIGTGEVTLANLICIGITDLSFLVQHFPEMLEMQRATHRRERFNMATT